MSTRKHCNFIFAVKLAQKLLSEPTMLKLDYVDIDFKGFRNKNEPYLVKENSVFGPSYQDTSLPGAVSGGMRGMR